jgi:threonine/homoserine/homoserine lactone efflux protein
VHAFLSGLIVGYGIAIPVGAIAVLIVTKAARENFRSAAAAGLGAATADLTYAVVAVAAGAALAPYVRALTTLIHLLSGCALGALAGYGIVRATHSSDAPGRDRPSALRPAYARFLALTLINPLTVVYFTSLVLATRTTTRPIDAAMFVGGVAIASASWQTFLAGSGALLGRTLVARGRLATALIGNGIILALALNQFTALR